MYNRYPPVVGKAFWQGMFWILVLLAIIAWVVLLAIRFL